MLQKHIIFLLIDICCKINIKFIYNNYYDLILGDIMNCNINFNNKNFSNNCIIKGKLIDCKSYPINNVLIILNDLKNKFKITTFSNNNGEFKFLNLDKHSKFELYFSKVGFPNKKIVNICFKESNIININFKYKNHFKFSYLKGLIFDKSENLPVKNIKVELFKITNHSNFLFYSTSSNKFGEFKINCLRPGYYFLKLSSFYYSTKYYNLIVYDYNDFLTFKTFLKRKYINSSTTIYGKVTNHLGEPINNADVILYKHLNKTLIPVYFTKTNINGYYFFKDIPLGIFLVKAIKYEII